MSMTAPGQLQQRQERQAARRPTARKANTCACGGRQRLKQVGIRADGWGIWALWCARCGHLGPATEPIT